MSGRYLRLFLLVVFLASSLGASGVGFVQPAWAAEERDGRPADWEQQVAADARGDVFVRWPGSVDLLYMVVGELYSITLGEPYIIIRIGYNVTLPGEEDLQFPDDPVPPGTLPVSVPDPSRVVPTTVLSAINITLNISRERSVRIGLFSIDHGETWVSDQGPLIGRNEDINGHDEVVYIAPLRRFTLETGDTLTDYNITATRNWRVSDTMEAFDGAPDYLPIYPRVHRLLDSLEEQEPLPSPVPLPIPFPPQPPVPIPPAPVDPRDHVPDDPWEYPPETGPGGVPPGLPTPRDVREWDPTNPEDTPPEVDPERLAEEPGEWPEARAWNATHKVTDGTGRLVARVDSEFYTASFNHVGWANFTIESRMENTDQRVLMLIAGITSQRWLWRYGLDMPTGIKDLPAGGTTRMSFLGVPNSLFAESVMPLTAVFISDWGGIDLVPVTFFNTNAPTDPALAPPAPGLPSRLNVTLLNREDPFRVNEVRKIMVSVRTGELAYFTELEAIRAYIHPAGTTVPTQPYRLREKDLMPGVYEIDFVFHRPGAWIVNVYFFDYPPNSDGQYPHIDFVVHVDHEGKSKPVLPIPAALGSLGLLMLAFVARDRMAKSR